MPSKLIRAVALDIETIARKSVIPMLDNPAPDANIKTPEKCDMEIAGLKEEIAALEAAEKSTKGTETKLLKAEASKKQSHVKMKASVDEKKTKLLDSMGMNPLHNQACCISTFDGENNWSVMLNPDESGESEKEMLMAAWEHLSKFNHYVTFNGINFDIRCLLIHGARYAIMPPIKVDMDKYHRGNHSDLYPALAGNAPFARGGLNFFAQYYLGRTKTEGMDGKEVQPAWDFELYDDIQKYCEEDTRITWDLYQVALNGGLLD